jgi:hypothetical protein
MTKTPAQQPKKLPLSKAAGGRIKTGGRIKGKSFNNGFTQEREMMYPSYRCTAGYFFVMENLPDEIGKTKSQILHEALALYCKTVTVKEPTLVYTIAHIL